MSNMAIHSDGTNVGLARRRNFHGLDLLRGVAALMIVLYHSEHLLGHPLVPNGYLAVDLFFVLSGFVISHAYDQRFSEGLGVGRFALMRIVRFWPLYVLGLSAGSLFEILLVLSHNEFAMSPSSAMMAFASGIFFIPTLNAERFGALYPLNVVAWSLFFELIVNILYAAFWPMLTGRVLRMLTLVSGVAFTIYSVLHGSANVGWVAAEIWPGLLRTVFSFTFGICLCRRNVQIGILPLWLLALMVAFFLSVPVPSDILVYFQLAFILILSPVIVAAGVSIDVPKRWLWISTLLGTLSYAIYAIHKPLLSFAHSIGRRFGIPPPLTLFVFIVLVGALCVALDRYYDVPLRRWISSRLGLSGRMIRSQRA